MLTGSVPYKAEEAVAIAIKHLTAPIPILPPQYSLHQSLLNKMLAKETDDRLQRGQDVVDAINQVETRSTSSSGVYLTATDPTAVQIYSLFRALLLTSAAAFMALLKQALRPRIRWSREKGFYIRAATSAHEIRTFAHTDESDFPTMITPGYQFEDSPQKKPTPLSWRLLFLSTLLTLVWILSAIGITRGNLEIEPDLPAFVPVLAKATHDFILPELTPKNAMPISVSRTNDTLTTSAEIERPTETPKQDVLTTETAPLATAPLEKETAEKETPQYYSLRVDSQPTNAFIRILNIKAKFKQNMKLPPGNYQLELSAPGFKQLLRWVQIDQQDKRLAYQLQPKLQAGQEFSDTLGRNRQGPKMVIVPSGEFSMGSNDFGNTRPVRAINIRKAFAVGKFEITFNDYDHYAQDMGLGRPSDKRWGYKDRPAIHVSWQDANDYVQWLNKKTGKPYRLLSEAEWEYAARAGTKSAYWWGDENKGVSANCKGGCNSEYTSLFRSKTAPIGRFKNNKFGLFDTAGNVAEWVSDCYQDHYLGSPRDGSAVNRQRCDARVVRGGSMLDKVAALNSAARTGLPAQSKLKNVGFRVALDIESRPY
jgi:serine/threonine-protein kinase PpkA